MSLPCVIWLFDFGLFESSELIKAFILERLARFELRVTLCLLLNIIFFGGHYFRFTRLALKLLGRRAAEFLTVGLWALLQDNHRCVRVLLLARCPVEIDAQDEDDENRKCNESDIC